MINLDAYQKLLDETAKYNAKIIAVSKRQEKQKIDELIKAGHKDLGENHAQALLARYEEIEEPVNWHFIGHLQSNKVKYIAPFIHLIHAVDSLKLLRLIDKEASKNNRTIQCLLQIHIAEEETKFGLNEEEADAILGSSEISALEHVKISGLMGMATYTENEKQIRREFRHLRQIFERAKERYFPADNTFSELSMGMSGDYKIALEEGSTMIRVGTLIFGARDY